MNAVKESFKVQQVQHHVFPLKLVTMPLVRPRLPGYLKNNVNKVIFAKMVQKNNVWRAHSIIMLGRLRVRDLAQSEDLLRLVRSLHLIAYNVLLVEQQQVEQLV